VAGADDEDIELVSQGSHDGNDGGPGGRIFGSIPKVGILKKADIFAAGGLALARPRCTLGRS
jgi:hypothetical protein